MARRVYALYIVILQPDAYAFRQEVVNWSQCRAEAGERQSKHQFQRTELGAVCDYAFEGAGRLYGWYFRRCGKEAT